MEEILFKAKRLDNGEWVEGHLIQSPYMDEVRSWISTPDDKTRLRAIATYYADWRAVEVRTDTICQYTGLTDKNGNEIWENDIVGEYSEYREEWYFAKVTYGRFNCSCCDGVYGWTFENGDIRCHKSYEVKGNIFDNPKLIGG